MPGAGDDQDLDDQGKKKKKTTDEEQDDDQDPGDQDDEDDSNGGEGEADDDLKDPEKVKKIIKSLRDENAKARLKNKTLKEKVTGQDEKMSALKKALGLESEEDSPEEKIQKLQARNAELEAGFHISELARENDVPKEHDDYFRFLLAKKIDELEDGDELSDDSLNEVLEKVRSLGGGKNKETSTGLGDLKKKPASKGGDMTPEQFVGLSIAERSKLYVDNQALYQKLFKAANEKNLL